MQTLKRINLDTVKEAFSKAGITEPCTGSMGRCVIGAVCYPKFLFDDFLTLGFDRMYLYGVMDGWDWGSDKRHSTWLITDSIDTNDFTYKIGRADGVAARNIMGITS